MFFKWLNQLNVNQFFAPTSLIILISTSFYYSTLDFPEKSYNYSYMIAAACLFALYKTFLLSFSQLEKKILAKKWFLLAINFILAIIQFLATFLAIRYLTESTFHQDSVQLLLLTNITFYIQVFFTNFKHFLGLAVITIAVYTICFVALYFKFLEKDSIRFILMQQTIGVLVLITEIINFLVTTRNLTQNQKQ